MSLNLGEETQIFKHSKDFEQGSGNIRTGQSTYVVSLDGSGDFASIQEAINALPSKGGIIYIKEGTYVLTTKVNITKSNTKIEGTGFGTIIYGYTGVNEPLFEINGKESIIIENLKFQSTTANSDGIHLHGTTRVEIIHCWFTGQQGVCILTDGTTESCIISENQFGTEFSTAITSNEIINKSIISNNIIVGPGTDTTKDGIAIHEANQCIYSGNNISAIGHNGITMIHGTRNIIEANNISGLDSSWTQEGITLGYSSSYYCTNCIIQGNIVLDFKYGIKIYYGDNCIIANNRVESCVTTGIYIKNAGSDRNVVVGNIALNNGTNYTDEGTLTDAGHNIIA